MAAVASLGFAAAMASTVTVPVSYDPVTENRARRATDVPATTVFQFPVGGVAGRASSVGLRLTVNDPNLAEIGMVLRAPNGAVARVFDPGALSGNWMDDTTLADSGGAGMPLIAGTSPYSGLGHGGFNYDPSTPFSGFAGIDPNGVWTLEVTDYATVGDGSSSTGGSGYGTDGFRTLFVDPEDYSAFNVGVVPPGLFDSSLTQGTALTITIGPGCGTADYNHDGSLGTDADIEDFFKCLSGDCCVTCGSPDFNGDGDIGTDTDIEAFFRILGGGPC
jgi:hypothetical protein